MHIDKVKNEVVFKIVYYGPGLGGKTTNLEFIYAHIDPTLRGNLISLKTMEDRTLFFDFMNLELGRIRGKKPRFHLYTIPGQVYYGYSRKIILRGADAVVFVADSQKNRMEDNLLTLEDLEKKLIFYQKSLASFPYVMQYNKRDLADIVTIQELQKKLNFSQAPYFEAVAKNGVGVFETLQRTIKLVLAKMA
jgi:mutual gliding-motility protein MglA